MISGRHSTAAIIDRPAAILTRDETKAWYGVVSHSAGIRRWCRYVTTETATLAAGDCAGDG